MATTSTSVALASPVSTPRPAPKAGSKLRASDPRRLAPEQRIGDIERDRMVKRLSRAYAMGYLDQSEHEIRLEQALTARTAGELATLLTDLPADRPTPTEVAEKAARRRAGARRGVIGHLALWLTASAVCLAIWLAITVTSGFHYFWPVWPFLGGGVGLLSHAIPVWLGGRSRAALAGRA